jgi:maleylpyruvate isomerase
MDGAPEDSTDTPTDDSTGSTRTAYPLPLVDETLLATTRYLQALTQLDDESTRQPSVLPGWSRGHVIAHLSRNADAFTQVLRQVAAGEPAHMYASNAARDDDIEDTVRAHDLEGLRHDAAQACARLADALTTFDGDPGASYARLAGEAATWPLTSVGGRRRTEVEIHHADLDAGYRPEEWPADFSLSIIKQRQDEMAALPQGCPSMVLSATDVPGLWKFGKGQGPEIHGTAGDLGWWLVGRGGGHGLTSSSGDLPDIGRWR